MATINSDSCDANINRFRTISIMNYIVRYRPSNGTPVPLKSLVFKSPIVAVHTAKRKIRLGVSDVSLSVGYPGVWDNAKDIMNIKDDYSNIWKMNPIDWGYPADHNTRPNHPEGQDQLTK